MKTIKKYLHIQREHNDLYYRKGEDQCSETDAIIAE